MTRKVYALEMLIEETADVISIYSSKDAAEIRGQQLVDSPDNFYWEFIVREYTVIE